ncbi:MAG: NGG1p interacting factor NIF3 [Candidatus Omnitrophica bacterium]|nr:NGG1p interacting factor NIF3 [Candidatus Omnitrophota bacterium]
MKLCDIYELIVKKGRDKDPRPAGELKEELSRVRREYRSLKGEDKKYYDREKLNHPYADTRILYGDRNKAIHTVMVGIDIDVGELLTAYLLNEKGAGIDLVMSHHPSGKALSNLHYVMQVHENILFHFGVNREIANSFMKERIDEISRRLSSVNHQRTVDAARLLDMPLMCVHTPADNHVTDFLDGMFRRKKPKRVSDVMKFLKGIPEYQAAMAIGAGPKLINGKESNKTGKIFVDMTGGTEGSKKVFARLSQAGVTTIVAMHLSEEHFKTAKAEFLNIIIAGHIASDNLGLNLVLDEVARKDDINIIPCSGFVRVKR